MPLAYATPLTAEIVEKGLRGFKFLNVPELNLLQSGGASVGVDMQVTDEPAPNMEGVTGISVLGQTDRGVSQPIASKLRRTQLGAESFFQQQIEDFYGEPPAPLQVMKLGSYKDDEGNVKFPMKEALAPFTTETRVIDTVQFGRAVSVGMQRFNNLSRNDCARSSLSRRLCLESQLWVSRAYLDPPQQVFLGVWKPKIRNSSLGKIQKGLIWRMRMLRSLRKKYLSWRLKSSRAIGPSSSVEIFSRMKQERRARMRASSLVRISGITSCAECTLVLMWHHS